MRTVFKEVLHPEIVLGRRGDPNDIKIINKLTACVEKEPRGWAVTDEILALKDEATATHAMLCKKYKTERPPIYRLGRDFGEVLSHVKADIPMDKLPERFFGYISFPSGVVRDETGDIYGAYVFIGPAEETSAAPKLFGKRMVWMSIIGYAEVTYSLQYVLMEIGTSFEETFKSLKVSDNSNVEINLTEKEILKHRMDAVRTIINSVLYIHSQEPNIEPLKQHNNLTNSERKKIKGHINLCTLPVIAVNWGYKRDRTFSVDETFRGEHLRWQRCGTNYSEVKLITVKGHTVRYKKEN